jgi:hypothetical protein
LGKKSEPDGIGPSYTDTSPTTGQNIGGTLMSGGTLNDYLRNSAEAKKEFVTAKPSKTHLKLLQKESFVRRQALLRERDAAGEDMVPTLMEEWPMFKYGTYLMDELKMIMGKTDREMADVRTEASKAVGVLTGMIGKDASKYQQVRKKYK